MIFNLKDLIKLNEITHFDKSVRIDESLEIQTQDIWQTLNQLLVMGSYFLSLEHVVVYLLFLEVGVDAVTNSTSISWYLKI